MIYEMLMKFKLIGKYSQMDKLLGSDPSEYLGFFEFEPTREKVKRCSGKGVHMPGEDPHCGATTLVLTIKFEYETHHLHFNDLTCILA
jgi:hypothetical protein